MSTQSHSHWLTNGNSKADASPGVSTMHRTSRAATIPSKCHAFVRHPDLQPYHPTHSPTYSTAHLPTYVPTHFRTYPCFRMWLASATTTPWRTWFAKVETSKGWSSREQFAGICRTLSWSMAIKLSFSCRSGIYPCSCSRRSLLKWRGATNPEIVFQIIVHWLVQACPKKGRGDRRSPLVFSFSFLFLLLLRFSFWAGFKIPSIYLY